MTCLRDFSIVDPMKKLYILLMIIIFAMLIAGCSEDSTNPSGQQSFQDEIIPLAVGNQWIYLYTDETTGLQDTLCKGVSGSEMFECEDHELREVFHWNWYNLDEGHYEDHKSLCYNTEEGFHKAGGISSSDSLFADYLTVKYPVSEGDSWIYTDIEYDPENSQWVYTDTLEAFCTAVDTMITTPAGFFTCIEVTLCRLGTEPGGLFVQRFYYSPNIGYIGFILYNNGVIRSKRLLMDYSINE